MHHQQWYHVQLHSQHCSVRLLSLTIESASRSVDIVAIEMHSVVFMILNNF